MTNKLTITKQIYSLSLANTKLHLRTVGTQGPPGPAGPSGDAQDPTFVAATVLSGHRAVYANADGEVEYASSDAPDLAHATVGVTTGAATAGSQATVRSFGQLTEASWNWDPNEPVFLGLNGLLTQTPPVTGAVQVIGYPTSPTTLFVSVQQPIILTTEE